MASMNCYADMCKTILVQNSEDIFSLDQALIYGPRSERFSLGLLKLTGTGLFSYFRARTFLDNQKANPALNTKAGNK